MSSEIIEGIGPDCLKSCYSSSRMKSKCLSGDLSGFRTAARSAREDCCANSCGGIPDGRTCVRSGPYQSRQKYSGGGPAVSFAVQTYGDEIVCSKPRGNIVISPIMYGGIRKQCILQCARSRLRRVCVEGRKDTVADGMYDIYGDCCERCGGDAIDGNLGCGYKV